MLNPQLSRANNFAPYLRPYFPVTKMQLQAVIIKEMLLSTN